MTLAAYLTDASWRQKAACRDVDFHIFFPIQGNQTSYPAKKICAACPVQAPCLDEALSHGTRYDYGVFGGTTPRERRALRKRRAA